jgi:hypothetical protein
VRARIQQVELRLHRKSAEADSKAADMEA